MSHLFKGVGVALVTPFTKDYQIDLPALTKLVELQITGGTDFLVVQGTTGESPNLSMKDREILYSTAIDSVGNEASIIAGTGTYSTKETVEITKMATNLGVDGIMIVTPYYSKPSQYGIIKHFEEVSKVTDLPVMAYNIPGRTSKLIELSTLEKLVDDIGIHSIKDAVGDLSFSRDELKLLNEKCHIYCGNDNETIEFMKMGAKGVVSVASHIVGKQIKNLITSVLDDKISDAEGIHTNLIDLFVALFQEPSPGPVKYLLTETWEDVGKPLLPITPISHKFEDELLNIYKEIK